MRRPFRSLTLLAPLGAALVVASGCRSESALPEVAAVSGDLPLVLTESGETTAARSTTIRAPAEWSGDMQLTMLVPEGTVVAVGDTLALFDDGFLASEMEEARDQLAAKEAERKALLAQQAARREQLINRRAVAELSRDQAELQLEKMRFESEARRQEAQLRLSSAAVERDEMDVKIRAQAVLDSLETARVDVEIADLETRLAGMQARADALVLVAPTPGLVIHAINTRGDSRVKVRVGDKVSPWGRVVEIPDLSRMQVEIPVHETDRHLVALGQAVRARLEAAPEKEFTGHIAEIARLATPRVEEGNVKVFLTTAVLDGLDPLLRPGMTAIVEVDVGLVEDAVLVPWEALFTRDGATVVYPADDWPRPRAVELGAFDARVVECRTGVAAGERLVTRQPDAPPAAAAPEPERTETDVRTGTDARTESGPS